jgi:hypothetical protein
VRNAAFAVEEGTAGTPGVFDGDDVLVFYAVGIRDDGRREDLIRKYSDYNVYWLGTSGGPQMATKPVPTGVVSTDTASVTFTATRHFETDFFFNEGTPPGSPDYYYANYGSDPGPIDEPFEVGAIQPGTSLDLTARMVGDRDSAPRAIRLSVVNSLGTTVLSAFESIPNKTQLDFQASVPASDLVNGNNAFRVSRPDNTRGGVEVLINWVDISYSSLLRAHGNRLDFDTGVLTGDTSVVVTGLTDTDVWLLDVTDRNAPVRCTIGPGHFTPTGAGGGGYALSFRDVITATKEYVVSTLAAMTEVSAADVDLDTPSALIGSGAESGVDVLVVSNAQFISRMQQWVTYRRAQGYRVLMADVEDVFDEFNNGVPHARAIDLLVRHFFELGNASALVLVGDSSEDAKMVEEDAGPNFVPTHSWTDQVASLNQEEVVTTDKEFVKLPGPTGLIDRYPDLIVGRLPVGGGIELDRVLAKTFNFEKPDADDFWRKRIIVVADDYYSEGQSTFGGFQFCIQDGRPGTNDETGFQDGQEVFASIIENAPPAGYEVVRFFLEDYTEAIHQEECIPRSTAIEYVRNNVNPLLMEELAQGATMVAIQSHMNRSLVTHEALLSTQSASILWGETGRDHLRMENEGRPFIIFGLGCHFSDYAIHKELSPGRASANSPNGDSFAEQLLFANNTGAVATYGSSGFEYLSQTNRWMTTTGRIWFYEAPYDTMINQTQGQWVYGQLMFLAEGQLASSYANAVERYHILGDPLLHIDAGPPHFQVTVNGNPTESGATLRAGSSGDSVRVVALVSDENAINDFKLTIENEDRTGDLTVEQLLDPQLAAGRRYRVEFTHRIRPRAYEIVLNAFQAPDTSGGYHMAAEFSLRVPSNMTLMVNGQLVETGAIIPARADFLIELENPVYFPVDSLSVTIDDAPVNGADYTHPSPEDSTIWNIRFTRTLSDGTHELVVRAGSSSEFRYELVVSSEVGLRNVINYPNPFEDVTSFMFENEVEINEGRIDIFSVTGKRIRRLTIPPSPPGNNAVYWDGRDQAGGTIANGVYLYVIKVTQRGQSSTIRGKLAHLE